MSFDIKAAQAKQAKAFGSAFELDMTEDKETELPKCLQPAFELDDEGEPTAILSETGTMLVLDEDTEIYVRWDSPALQEVMDAGVVRRDQILEIDGRMVLTGSNRSRKAYGSKR